MTKRAASAPTAKKELDPLLVAACERIKLDVTKVLAWGLYADRVVVIASDGRKLEIPR
jgi:hypothetical protein